MEVQWMLVARGYQLHSNGLLDIIGSFERFSAVGPPFKAPFVVIAKLRFDPLDAGKDTTFLFSIVKVEGEKLVQLELPYNYPTLEQWLGGATLFIVVDVTDVEFPDIGEYAIEFRHNDNLIAYETFRIAHSERSE